MVDDFQRRLGELRYVDGVEKVEHVPYPTGDEFWVRFNRPFDKGRLEDLAKKHGWAVIGFGGLPSKLPRQIGELIWNGVRMVIATRLSGWAKFTSSLGFEPDGIAKIAQDAHGPYQIFIATQEQGVQLLYEYLGLKYVAPAPPPKPVPQPQAAASAKPSPAAPKPTVPTPAPPVAAPKLPAPASPSKPADEKPTPKPTSQG